MIINENKNGETNTINAISRTVGEIESPRDVLNNNEIKYTMYSRDGKVNSPLGDQDHNLFKSGGAFDIEFNYNMIVNSNSLRIQSLEEQAVRNNELPNSIQDVTDSRQNIDEENPDLEKEESPKEEENNNDGDGQKNENKKKNFQLQRINSTANLLEDEYFGEDTSVKETKRNKYINPDMFSKLRDHHVDWDTKVFIEILWYHILNYILIGPFINLVYYKKIKLMRNLQFWGISRAFFIQTFFYFFNVLIVVSYFSSSSPNIYFVEIVFTFVILILRCYIIACKYATLHPDKIKLYRDYVLDLNLTLTDYYLNNWIQQDDQTLYRETYNALQRGEFDPSLFYISFFVEPSQKTVDELVTLNENIGKQHKFTTVKYQPKSVFPAYNTQYFFGYSILGFIIRQFNKENGKKNQIIYALSLAMIRTAIPIVYRYIYRENFEFNRLEITQLVALSINNFFGYFFSFIFLFFYIRDMRMKDYILTQCKLILQVKKLHLSERKILPTIDIINPYSLKGWSILRRVSLDYGKQYVLRLQSYLTIYFFSIFVTTIILILWILKIYKLDNIYPIICLFEIIVPFSILLYILFWGCLLNECFDNYKNTLGDHKVLFLDIMRMKSIYFKQDSFSATNFVLKKSLQKIQNILNLKNTYDEQKIHDYLQQLMSSISDCENELEQDFRNQPFTIYGITITLPMFQKLCVGIITIAAGFVQIYLFMNKTISLS